MRGIDPAAGGSSQGFRLTLSPLDIRRLIQPHPAGLAVHRLAGAAGAAGGEGGQGMEGIGTNGNVETVKSTFS